MTFIQRLKAIFFQPLKASLPRFPEAVLTAFLLGILTVINTELTVFNQTLNDLNITLFLLIPLFIVHTLLREQFPKLSNYRWFIFTGLLLLGFSFWLFLRLEPSQAVIFNRFSNLIYAAYLLVMFVPFVFKKKFLETGIILLFTKLFTAMLYAGVLYLGVFIVLISANVLFSLSFELTLYANVFVLINAFVFVPIFLGSYPQPTAIISVKKDYHVIWQRIFLFVIAPVISIFTLLVTVYLFTGFFNADTYEAEVYTFSSLVIAFAGISAQVALTPFIDKNRFIQLFVRFFHYGLLLVMIGYYIEQIKTIGLTGFTLSVVIQMMLGLWPLTYVLFKFIKPLQATKRGLWMLVGTFAWIAAMPGLNAVSITTMLLQAQFRQLLVANDMLANDGTIIGQDILPDDVYDDLYQTVNEMDRLGLHRFSILPENYQHPTNFDTTFGFKENDPSNPRDEYLQFNLLLPVIDLSDFAYDQLIYVSSLLTLKDGETYLYEPVSLSLTVNQTLGHYYFDITKEGMTDSIELYTDIALVLQDRFAATEYESDVKEDFLISFEFTNMTIDLWVTNLISMRYQSYADLNLGFYLGINHQDA